MGVPQQVDSSVSALVGQTLDGRYRIDGVLARGGMSFILFGQHLTLHREIAIKVLDPDRALDRSKQFIAEAENAARLDHPNCIHVSDYGTTPTGLQYMVMPLLRGGSLEDQLDGNPMPPKKVVGLGLQILRGLEHAHRQGVIHRDLKPANLFMADDADHGRVLKIVDFGIAKLKSAETADLANVTMSGLMSGTPGYMSPEQALGLETDERTDLYAVGLILYRLITGAIPFDSPDPVTVLQRQLTESIPPLPSTVPVPLAAFVEKMLEHDRDQRYASANAALDALEEVEARLPTAIYGSQITMVEDGRHGAATSSIALGSGLVTVRARGSIGRKAIVGLGLAGLVAVAAFVGLNPDVIGLAPASADEQIVESDVVSVGGVTADRHAVVPDDATETDPVRLLGAVNEARIDHALPFESRHKVLDQLHALGRIHQVDDRLNLGLDLLQAEQSPTPCATFDAALAEILRLDDEYFDALLERVTVPQGDEAACRGLQEKFEQHTGDGEPQAEATAAPRRSKKASRRRASSSKPKQTSTASTSYDRLPTKPPPATTQDHAAEKKAPALEKLDSDVRPLQ